MSDITIIGLVRGGNCGVRDQAEVQARALREAGWTVHLALDTVDVAGVRAAFQSASRLLDRVRSAPPGSTVVWHYSPFTHAHRGVPTAAVAAGIVARWRRVRVVTVLHELAYDWRHARGARRILWLLQRTALGAVALGSDVLVVTTQRRADTLERLPGPFRRPTTVVPVSSNLPQSDARPRCADRAVIVGIFGYIGDGIDPALVIDGLARCSSRSSLRVLLIGGPGDTPDVHTRWLDPARAQGLDMDLTGVLGLDELAAAIAGCDVIIHANREGPSARKTTLAGALSAGRPVVALDGWNTWRELVEHDAVRLVRPDPDSLARGLDELITSPDDRDELGRCARRFYDEHMQPTVTSASIAALLLPPLRIAFVVNRGGNMERRVRDLVPHLPGDLAPSVHVRPSLLAAWRAARMSDVVYVIDPGKRGFPAAAVARLARRRVVVEVGDPQGALYRAQGRSRLASLSGAIVDRLVATRADGVVVRGRRLVDTLGIEVRSAEIPDGVDLEVFKPVADARAELGIPPDAFVVGTVGALKLSGTPTRAYGWDLIDAAAVLQDDSIWILIVGDGDGVDWLRERAAAAGVAHRLTMPGRVDHGRVPSMIASMDVCVSTQSNDVIGAGRTTAKLPEYLACDRYVLATAVGGAADVLPDEMLLPFDGSMDPAHPPRLAARLAALAGDVGSLRHGAGTRRLAARYAYPVLAGRLAAFVRDIARPSEPTATDDRQVVELLNDRPRRR